MGHYVSEVATRSKLDAACRGRKVATVMAGESLGRLSSGVEAWATGMAAERARPDGEGGGVQTAKGDRG